MHVREWEDLRQFIDSRLTQIELSLRREFRRDLAREIDSLKEPMKDGFRGIAEAIEDINERIDSPKTT